MADVIKYGIINEYYNSDTIFVFIGFFVVILGGYLLGSLNFGIILSKLMYNDDIRKYGSKNAGMTNMLRTYGKKAAVLTFLLDGLKTVIAVFIGRLFLGNLFAGGYFGGFASILGHAFPVYYKFRGGKSVTATAFMVLCTDPIIFLILIILWTAIVLITKTVSISSIIAVMAYPIFLHRISGPGLHVVISVAVMLLVVFLHRSNLKRIFNGTESKLDLKLKKK